MSFWFTGDECATEGHHWHAIPEALSAQCCECGVWLYEVDTTEGGEASDGTALDQARHHPR